MDRVGCVLVEHNFTQKRRRSDVLAPTIRVSGGLRVQVNLSVSGLVVASGDFASGNFASGDFASGDVASGDVASGDVASGDFFLS